MEPVTVSPLRTRITELAGSLATARAPSLALRDCSWPYQTLPPSSRASTRCCSACTGVPSSSNSSWRWRWPALTAAASIRTTCTALVDGEPIRACRAG